MRAQVIFGCSKCFENCCSIYTMYILFAYSFFQTSDSSFHYLLVCFFLFYNTYLYLFIHFDSFLGSFAIDCSFTCLLRFFCAFVYFLLHLFFLSSIVWVIFSFFFGLFFWHFIQLFTQTDVVTFTSWRSLDEKNNHFITFSHLCYSLLWTLHNKDEWHMFPSRCSSIKRIHPRYDGRF